MEKLRKTPNAHRSPRPPSGSSRKNSTKDNTICCKFVLKKFCNKVELRERRVLNICQVPGSEKIDQSQYSCLKKAFSSYCEHLVEPNIYEEVERIDEGLRKSTIIFLLHGVGGEIKVWLPQILYLNKLGFTTVSMDFIGHGESFAPSEKEAYHFKELSKDVIELFLRFRTESNIIIGHSYGCTFASIVAYRYENWVKGLIMISGGGPIPLGPELGVFVLPSFFLSIFEKTVKREFFRRAFHKGNKDNLCYLAAVNAPARVIKNILKGQDWQGGHEGFFSSIKCQTLLIHGENDRLIPHDEVTHMDKTMKRSELKSIKDVGHMVMLETPALCNNYIAEHIIKILKNNEKLGAKDEITKETEKGYKVTLKDDRTNTITPA